MSDVISSRKDAHIDLCLDRQVEAHAPSLGLGGYRLEYDALPELDLDQVDLSCQVLGQRLRAPLIVGSMTGGTERAGELNRRLARAAARTGVGMALGSQRAMIVRPELTATFAVRDAAPELPLLLGNVGAVQLNYGVSAEEVAAAARGVGADGMYFHLNPLQEAIQPEGDTRFSGLLGRLAEVIPLLPVPALVKEVGAGISERTARKLASLPLGGVEVAGVGGTSWSRVESYRAPEGSAARAVGEHLAGFGIPTARSVLNARAAMPGQLIVASGGVRRGLDVAVALALGADAVAMARPLLAAAVQGEDAVVRAIEQVLFELRVVCFCTGAASIRDLCDVRVWGPDSAPVVRAGREAGIGETSVASTRQ